MFVLWLTGISGSGKTTIGKRLFEEIGKLNDSVEFLDGDEIRGFFNNDLGYTREARVANNKRIIFAAKLLERNNVITIVANIAPYTSIRQFAQENLKHYIQVYVKASQLACVQRDVQGHYAKVAAGEMKNFIGQDDEYETPESPQITVDTEKETVKESVNQIMEYLKGHNYL